MPLVLKAGATAVTPAVPGVATIRCLSPDDGSHAVDRLALRAIQTPQGFDRQIITECRD